jgi:hypothetical protein
MKDRLVVLALALGALTLFYVLLFPKPRPAFNPLVLPLSAESRPEGYLAIWRWLGEQHIPAISLRERYDHLKGMLRAPTGNVLIMTLPQRTPVRVEELRDLRAWEESGNTLLVMAAVEDTPLWTLGADSLFEERLARITGLRFDKPTTAKVDLQTLTQDRFDIEPRGPHPLTTGVRHVTALSALPPRRASLHPGLESIPLELATHSDTHDTTLWLSRHGDGQTILSTAASIFSNGAVALTDNAQLLANILARSLGPGGAVIFDDAHQGLTTDYDANAFFADPRLHDTLGWIVLLWLLFVLGALPLRVARTTWQPLDEAAYVEASARYFAAVVPPSDAAQRLIEGFLRGLARRSSPEQEPSLWGALDAHAGVSLRQRESLQQIYSSACAGKAVHLVRLQNSLSQLRRTFE